MKKPSKILEALVRDITSKGYFMTKSEAKHRIQDLIFNSISQVLESLRMDDRSPYDAESYVDIKNRGWNEAAKELNQKIDQVIQGK
jgi:hypothetical protein